MSDLTGKTISHYRILEKIGEGGMGVVYKAQDTKLERFVALKFLPHHLTATESDRLRFLQEAKAAASLNHPNVCSVIDLEEVDGTQFIVMEYVDGETLRVRLPIQQTNDVIRYAGQIAEALNAAHAKGMVHRDIKSENIMVTTDDQIKVMDFGLAKLKGSVRLTRSSSTVGTMAYMSPEQIQALDVDHRSDQFSFGVVLFEMLTGHLPFRGEHEAAMMYSIVNEEPAPVQSLRKDAPDGLAQIIQRLLAKNAEDRFASTGEIVQALRALGSASWSGLARSPAKAGRKWNVVAAGSVAAILLGVAGYLYFQKPAHSDEPMDSIAVLPFRNVGGDPNTQYLSDGMTESIINALSRLRKMRVVPRSTVFHYQGKEDDARTIGDELHVRSVLTGRVIQRGDDLNIQVELIDVQQQSQLWGEQYVRKLTDLLSVQDEIGRAIAVQLRLTGEETQALTRHATENTEAYQLYLKGRYYWDKRSVAGFGKALQYFQESLDLDPNFPLAYTGVADCYDLLGLGIYNGLPSSDAQPKAKAAIEKAFQLDSTLGEAYTTRGHINHSYEWDWPRAERDYRRAIELSPKYGTARAFYGAYLNVVGRTDEALEQFQIGQQVEPLSLPINAWLGWEYYFRRDYDRSIDQLRKTSEIDPDFANAHYILGWVYLAKGMNRESESEFRIGMKLSNNNPVMEPGLIFALSRAGDLKAARAEMDSLLSHSKERYISPHNLALAYAGIGDKENFYKMMERTVDEHAFIVSVGVLRVDPIFDPYRGESRFKALMNKAGIL